MHTLHACVPYYDSYVMLYSMLHHATAKRAPACARRPDGRLPAKCEIAHPDVCVRLSPRASVLIWGDRFISDDS